MPVDTILLLLGFGAVSGAIGQVIRMLVGLKKLAEQTATAEELTTKLENRRIVISIMIGASAGAIAAATTITDPNKIDVSVFTAMLAAGYAGADFIEGAMKKLLPTVG